MVVVFIPFFFVKLSPFYISKLARKVIYLIKSHEKVFFLQKKNCFIDQAKFPNVAPIGEIITSK